MDVYTTESEQIAQLHQLWKKYGVSTLVGIAIALLASWGWRHWVALHERALAHASVHYEELLADMSSNNVTSFEQQSSYLLERYPKTVYAKLTALMLADVAVHEQHLGLAEDKLTWVVRTGDNDVLRSIAAIRLARVQLADHKAQDALNTLKKVNNDAYRPLAEEVKGDIYVSLQQAKNARDAYTLALKLLPALRTERPILEMKLNNL